MLCPLRVPPKLKYACTVVQPGRTFLRHMFELLMSQNQAEQSLQSDLIWWHTFLALWNGRNLDNTCESHQVKNKTLQLQQLPLSWTDAI